MKLSEWAKGKWPLIIMQLVGEQYANPRKHGPCPKGEGMDRFRFSDVHEGGNYFCACSQGEKGGFDLLQCVHGWDFRTAAKEIEAIIGKAPVDLNGKEAPKGKTYAEKLKEEAAYSPRSRYLESRGLEVAPGLLFHRAVDYYDSDGKKINRFPAMLAPIMRNGKFNTMHVTYLEDGAKAKVDCPKKILPGPPNTGGACQLYPHNGELGIAEGIETAIAAKMLFNIPTWAALNAPLMKSWDPPEGVTFVAIFADHDENYAGHAAAYALAHKLKLKGIKVEIEMPSKPNTDWNDVLLEGKPVA